MRSIIAQTKKREKDDDGSVKHKGTDGRGASDGVAARGS